MAHLITKVFEPSRTQQKIANNYPIRLSSWTPATPCPENLLHKGANMDR